ncbi:unnamed protein product [Musa acuminata subsp. malaccensis]|uniref:(wild Malaysian banana) hypothetical protein n=1 Tax=Musa acuminata subsp. malaccensis TaxID=214687 RepID=A0A804K986_MUSAM|nr:unnamed protein product [Musa acuminata subsp. malaccensis]
MTVSPSIVICYQKPCKRTAADICIIDKRFTFFFNS